MEVKPGYKQTEVGVFPEEWAVKPIFDCCEYADYRGKTPPKTKSGIFLVTARNVRKGFIDYVDSQEFVPSELYDQIMRRGRPLIGDVLITTEAPLGNIAQIDREDVALAQRIIKYRPKSEELSATYLKHYFLSDRFQKVLDDHSSGSTAKGIKGRVLHQLPVVLPPLPEQRAIATTLSDVDALLAGLDRLIAKKRDLKQAAVQQLLTGQTRLPGFHGEWEVKRLGAGISLHSGHHVLAQHCNTQSEGVPYLTGPADFPEGRVRHTKFTTRPSTICSPNDILVTVKGSGSGTIVLADAAYCISRQLMAIRVSDWNVQFIYYSLLQNAAQFRAASTGLIPGLSRSDILDQPMPLPPTIPEQTTIAEVLTDMDAELAALEQRREKCRALKQAMMQELLTGRTRLV